MNEYQYRYQVQLLRRIRVPHGVPHQVGRGGRHAHRDPRPHGHLHLLALPRRRRQQRPRRRLLPAPVGDLQIPRVRPPAEASTTSTIVARAHTQIGTRAVVGVVVVVVVVFVVVVVVVVSVDISGPWFYVSM